MLSREFLATIGFKREGYSERPHLRETVEIWFHPDSETFIAFYYDSRTPNDPWPDASLMNAAALIQQLMTDMKERVSEAYNNGAVDAERYSHA